MQTLQEKTIPYKPIVINGNLFTDPDLSDQDKVMIALAHVFRTDIMYESDPVRKKSISDSIRVSKFAAARNKNRDHVRRQIGKMQDNENVRAYVSIYCHKVNLNTEDLLIFHFKDQLPEQINIKHQNQKQVLNKIKNGLSIDWQQETLIKSYLKDSTLFHGESPLTLLELTNVDSKELVKGLVYCEAMNRRIKIKNPAGYLLSCFDAKGKFKYDDKPLRYLPNDSITHINDRYEFEISNNDLILIDDILNKKYDNKVKIIHRKNNVNQKVYVKRIIKAGRDLNPRNWFKKYDIEFKIVHDLEAV